MNYIGTLSRYTYGDKSGSERDTGDSSLARSRAKSRESRLQLMTLLQRDHERSKQGNDGPVYSNTCRDSEVLQSSGTTGVPVALDNENEWSSLVGGNQGSFHPPSVRPSSSMSSQGRHASSLANNMVQRDSFTFEKGYSTVEPSISTLSSWETETQGKPRFQVHSRFPSYTPTPFQKEPGLVKKKETLIDSGKESYRMHVQKRPSNNQDTSADTNPRASESFETETRVASTQTELQDDASNMSLSEGVESVKEELKRVQESEVEALRNVDRLQERVQQLRKRKQQLILRLKQATSTKSNADTKYESNLRIEKAAMQSSSPRGSCKKRKRKVELSTSAPLVSSNKTASPSPLVDDSTFNALISKVPMPRESSDDAIAADLPSLIHHACRRYSLSESVVAGAIRVDSENVTRRLSNPSTLGTQGIRIEYEYPINIAIQQNATAPVLKLLANAGPTILAERDGPEQCSSVSCALYNRRDEDVVSLLVAANPNQTRTFDRHGNLPLHVACLYAPTLSVVKLLASIHCCALWTRNHQGESPLDIAQREGSYCSNEVVDYLQLASFGMLEDKGAVTTDCGL